MGSAVNASNLPIYYRRPQRTFNILQETSELSICITGYLRVNPAYSMSLHRSSFILQQSSEAVLHTTGNHRGLPIIVLRGLPIFYGRPQSDCFILQDTNSLQETLEVLLYTTGEFKGLPA